MMTSRIRRFPFVAAVGFLAALTPLRSSAKDQRHAAREHPRQEARTAPPPASQAQVQPAREPATAPQAPRRMTADEAMQAFRARHTTPRYTTAAPAARPAPAVAHRESADRDRGDRDRGDRHRNQPTRVYVNRSYSPYYDPYYAYDPWYRGYAYPNPYYTSLSPMPSYAYQQVIPVDVAALKLDVKPKDAEVYVDGNYAGQAREFDSSSNPIWTRPGEHQVEIQRDGYETVRATVRVDGGRGYELKYRLRELGEPGGYEPNS